MRIAFLPTTPLLIPEVATGAAADLEQLRGRAVAAVNWACAGAQDTAILVPGDHHGPLTDWALDGFGIRVGTGEPVILPTAIAGWLLGHRAARVVGSDHAARSLPPADAVLVMGDGSASRGPQSPGHLHPGALAFDDLALAALRAGNPRALAGLDPATAEEVRASGPPVWRALAPLLASVSEPRVDLADDPFGVLYVVARWTARWAGPA